MAAVETLAQKSETVDFTSENLLNGSPYTLSIRQQPQRARVSFPSEKVSDKRQIDPCPIVELKFSDPNSHGKHGSLASHPSYFMKVDLVDQTTFQTIELCSEGKSLSMSGPRASSLHRLKDLENVHSAFFLFPDLTVRLQGDFRLKFTLYEWIGIRVYSKNTLISDVFTVYSSRAFPGILDPTSLSKCFSDQGMKIKIKKDLAKPLSLPIQKKRSSVTDGEEEFSPVTISRKAFSEDASIIHSPTNVSNTGPVSPGPRPAAVYTTLRPRLESDKTQIFVHPNRRSADYSYYHQLRPRVSNSYDSYYSGRQPIHKPGFDATQNQDYVQGHPEAGNESSNVILPSIQTMLARTHGSSVRPAHPEMANRVPQQYGYATQQNFATARPYPSYPQQSAYTENPDYRGYHAQQLYRWPKNQAYDQNEQYYTDQYGYQKRFN